MDGEEPAGGPAAEEEALPQEELLYQETQAILGQPERADRKSLGRFWLIITIVLYVLARKFLIGDARGESILTLLFLVAALFIHEAGHSLGMRLFGYRDIKIYFIPLFGAAATGKKHAAPAWQRGIVLLLGPLPGIALAAALAIGLRPPPGEALFYFVLLLIVLNGFNLLPLIPFDGGRLLNLLIFSRHPVLEVGFLFLAQLGLGGLGLSMNSWILIGLAVLGFLELPSRYRKARRRALLRKGLPAFPARLEDLSEEERRALFRLAHFVEPGISGADDCARKIREIHEDIVVRPPGLGATVLLLAFYGAAWFLALLGIVPLVSALK